MDETNLLSLIRLWLDTNCQITMKRAIYKIFCNWTRPRLGWDPAHEPAWACHNSSRQLVESTPFWEGDSSARHAVAMWYDTIRRGERTRSPVAASPAVSAARPGSLHCIEPDGRFILKKYYRFCMYTLSHNGSTTCPSPAKLRWTSSISKRTCSVYSC
jgi:hypothetical protein